MPQHAIAVEGLSFEYPGARALNEVRFTVGRGSVTALVGPNGAGKTALLRCLAGLNWPLQAALACALLVWRWRAYRNLERNLTG